MKSVLVCVFVVLAALGCSDATTNLVSAPSTAAPSDAATDASGSDSGPGTSDSGGTGGAGSVEDCGRGGCACNDGKDNDDDGLIDGLDPECTGPYDDDEERFGTGRGEAPTACVDCFWDNNEVSEDDGCTYAAACRTESAVGPPLPGGGPPGAAACLSCDVTPRCIDTCRARTPNGCDCFGCCDVTRGDGSVVQVLLADDCSVKAVDDEERCPRCVQSTQCLNPCGPCELCPGRKAKDLPAECRGETGEEPQPSCDEGYQVCSELAACADEYYCQLGCCLVVPQ